MSKRAILLGIDGLSYSSFMKCSPRFLMALFNSTFRGVVKNDRLKDRTAASWLEILTMDTQNPTEFLSSPPPLPLIEATRADAINIPITNPTYGVLSLDLKNVDYFDEISKVKEAALRSLSIGRPVIASITSIDRALSAGMEDIKCKLYAEVDRAVKELLNVAEDFIVFSPYGEIRPNGREPYGVFLASVPRPHEHDTVSLVQIGRLFLDLVGH
jgi:hypothetical protein